MWESEQRHCGCGVVVKLEWKESQYGLYQYTAASTSMARKCAWLYGHRRPTKERDGAGFLPR